MMLVKVLAISQYELFDQEGLQQAVVPWEKKRDDRYSPACRCMVCN